MPQNDWLFKRLQANSDLILSKTDLIIQIVFEGNSYTVYVPEMSEYLVTSEVVEKARNYGANFISFAKGTRSSSEAEAYAEELNIKLDTHANTLRFFRC